MGSCCGQQGAVQARQPGMANDAALARKLQEEENRAARTSQGRASQGRTTQSRPAPKESWGSGHTLGGNESSAPADAAAKREAALRAAEECAASQMARGMTREAAEK